MKFNLEEVRQAASGHWSEIIQSVANVSPDSLDGKHGPCVKCGGTDRFRVFDDFAQTGGMLCNQCAPKGASDGFGAVQWMLGCKFPEAVGKVAEYLHIQPSKNGKGRKNGEAVDPAKDLKWRDWSSELCAYFLKDRPGISEAAIIAAGGRRAVYKGLPVIAFPIVGEALDTEKPVGWVIVHAMGGTLPKYSPKGEVVDHVRHKTTYGSATGFLGVSAVELLKREGMVETCWKVEGLTDMLAVAAAIPEDKAASHVAIANSSGTQQKPGWMASHLARVKCYVIHDADEPGQVGAQTWANAIAVQGGKPRIVTLPYEVTKDHGKDVRDWLGESNSYGDLLALAETGEEVEVKRTADGEIDWSDVKFPIQDRMFEKLQAEVLYETADGRVRMFSGFLGKSSWIGRGQISKLKMEDITQLCGPPATVYVSGEKSDAPDDDSWSVSDFRKAVALFASSRRERNDERGAGIWPGRDEHGMANDAIVLVGNREAARWDGQELTQTKSARIEGLVCDYHPEKENWYEFCDLSRWCQEAKNKDWCNAVIDESAKFFNRWVWKNREADPALMTGLILASWIQTIWEFRPLVCITGDTATGKSMLLQALGGDGWQAGIFGSLAFKQSEGTEAGVRQGIGNTARIIMCDEFEQSRDRVKILEMFRASTRGDSIARGTADQQGRLFTLRHIGWVAAIESGLHAQPDMNRFVHFELREPAKEDQGKLCVPENGWLKRLGQKLLAIAVVHANAAKKLAVGLKAERFENIDPRTVEVYAVPAAILSVAMELSGDGPRSLLQLLLGCVEAHSQGGSNQNDLMNDILDSLVNCGPEGNLSVRQILDAAKVDPLKLRRIEAVGVAIDEDRHTPLDLRVQRLVIAHKVVSRELLYRNDNWRGKKLDEILSRIPGARAVNYRMGGGRPRGWSVPWNYENVDSQD